MPLTPLADLWYAWAMTKNENSGNDPQYCSYGCKLAPGENIYDHNAMAHGWGKEDNALQFNYWVIQRAMTGVLSIDDYDELRDF